MVTLLPFRISVFDKDFNPLDWAGAPVELRCNLRLNAASTAVFTLDADDPQVGVLTAEGARVVVEYFHDPEDPWNPMVLLSGMVGERTGESSTAGTRTFEVWDDWAYVMGLVGVPNPAGDITQQGDETAYFTLTGPAETVVKGHVDAVAGWYDVPVTTSADLERGDDVSVAVRMHPLADRLFPAVTQAGVRVTAVQSGAGIVVDCVEPDVVDFPLTEASGVVQAGAFDAEPPTITRVLIGGGGEGTARVFVVEVNTAVEAAWGVVLPIFVDARDTTDPAVLTARAWEKLNEGAPKSRVTAALAETDDFRFGVTVNLGDEVEVALDGAPPITDRVTEVELTWTTRGGLVVTPRVGEVNTTFPELVTAALEQVARRTRDQDARS